MRFNRLLFCSTALLGAGAFAPHALAQAAPADEQAPDVIVVTGSRLATDGTDSPTPLTVASDEQLQLAAPRSLGEALDWLRRESDLHEVLGKEFITVYSEIKELEF